MKNNHKYTDQNGNDVFVRSSIFGLTIVPPRQKLIDAVPMTEDDIKHVDTLTPNEKDVKLRVDPSLATLQDLAARLSILEDTVSKLTKK